MNPSVVFESPLPVRYDRMLLVLRLAILLGLAVIGGSLGWVYAILYLALPVLAAASVSGTPATPSQEGGFRVEKVVRWVVQFFAFMAVLTDTPPWVAGGSPVRFEVHAVVHPTTSSTLLRLVTSIPAAIVTAVVNVVGGILALVAIIVILVNRTVPEGIHSLLHKIIGLNARLLAYHASLVDDYPLGSGQQPAVTHGT